MLRGRVVELDETSLVLDAGGVGYEVFCHLRTSAELHRARAEGAEVTLQVHTSVTDDAIRLYGFLRREELALFRLLLGVERIGPKAALGILGRSELPVLVRALRGGDAKLVATVPGIGPKTAQRVVLELRDRLDGLTLPGDVPAPPGTGEAQAVTAAVEGLKGLGFRESEARAAVAAAVSGLEGEPEVSALVAAALRRLDTVPV